MYRAGIIFIGLFALISASGLFAWIGNASSLSISNIDYPLTPTLHNLSDGRISSVEVGQQSMIRITMHNNIQAEQPFVNIVEVRDGSGVTQHLTWQSGSIAPNSDYTMENSWTPHVQYDFPSEVCSNYEIRSFAVSSLVNPQILSYVSIIDGITVTSSPTYSSPRHYDLLLNNQTFQIDYSFSGGKGKITRIDADVDTASRVISLITPANSRLSIFMPPELVEHMLPNINDEFVVFVDQIAEDADQGVDPDTGSLSLVIPLEQGAEEIEVIGSFPI